MGRTASELGVVRLRALDEVDGMPSELRECVHEFGLPIVRCCLKFGVRNPVYIRELVREIWDGAREVGPQNNGVRGTLDWLIVQANGLSAATLQRVLADHNMTIAPLFPTREMLNASMAEVSGFNVKCTREEKHRRRLVAALAAASKSALEPKRARRQALRATPSEAYGPGEKP